MKDLIESIKKWFLVKTARNPSPEIEKKIEECKIKLHEQVSLLRLSNAELMQTSKNLRFGVMEQLINDIARSKT